MCGIWAYLRLGGAVNVDCAHCVKQLEPRGPEYTSVLDISGTGVTLGFTRLAINGLTTAGHQPFIHNNTYIVCNGEIYNYKLLATEHSMNLSEGTSDCAVIPHLYTTTDTMTTVCRSLDGVFAFVMVDAAHRVVHVARDPYGVRPLFAAVHMGNRVWSSELKGLPADCTDIQPFPPGTWETYNVDTGALVNYCRYHTIPTQKEAAYVDRSVAATALHDALVAAVHKRLMSDRPIGALLSGGLDSSLIASIASRELARSGKRLHTFSIGMPGSTDLAYAEKVAKHIDSVHHTVCVTPTDFLQAIPHVIHDIESYDITTVRASVGNWLIGKYIKEHTDIKVVFNGDGSDEIGGGYIYFYAAPSDDAFEAECTRLLDEINMFDVLRSDRSMAAHGLEARTPFLDKHVVATWLAIPTAFCRPVKGAQVEKAILRTAFAAGDYLPTEVLLRKKEAFSDGVSSTEYSWYKRCADYARASGLTLHYIQMMTAGWHNPPATEEAFYYRRIFEESYGAGAARSIPHMWMPRWIATASDPSARTLTDLY